MSRKGFRRLHAAYTSAWTARVGNGATSDEQLLTSLREHGLDEFAEPGLGRDLMLRYWHDGIPPDRLERELKREMPRVAAGAAKELAASTREIWRLFRDMEWEKAGLSWLDLPPGYIKLTDHRRAHDLLLRWFHPGVEEVTLPVDLDDGASEVLQRCRFLPSANRDGWFEAPIWLKLDDQPRGAEVMVGDSRVGWTRLSDAPWRQLKREAARSVFADGSIFLPMNQGDERAAELKVHVPRQGRH